MSDIGWCNHITVTHGVCGLCGQYVGSSGRDAARDNEIARVREELTFLRAEGDAANDLLTDPESVNLDAPIVKESELCQNILKLRERAERAEAERDALMDECYKAIACEMCKRNWGVLHGEIMPGSFYHCPECGAFVDRHWPPMRKPEEENG